MTLKLPENSSEYSSNRFLYCSMVVRRAWSLGKSKATDIVPSSFRMVVPGNMMVLLRRHHFSKDMIGDQGKNMKNKSDKLYLTYQGRLPIAALRSATLSGSTVATPPPGPAEALGAPLGFALAFARDLAPAAGPGATDPPRAKKPKFWGDTARYIYRNY